MDPMTQPQDSRPDDAPQVSSVKKGVEESSINSPGDQTSAGDEDHSHEKKSLLSKVKNKAKDKVNKVKDKLKTKVKKDKESGTCEEEDEEEVEVNDVEVHPKTSLNTPTSGFAEDGSYVNHGKPVNSFGVDQNKVNTYSSAGDEPLQKEYDGFLRSTKDGSDGESRDFTSVPTDYSSPQASVDAVMPPPVISPGSASDLGEQSSSSLGEIPEKPKEEEKVVATEAPDEHSHSSQSFGQFGDTSRDKLSLSDEREDLEALERDSMSQELGDGSKETKFAKRPSGGITQQPREDCQESPLTRTDEESEAFTEKPDQELPSDEAALSQREPEKGTEDELPSAKAAAVSRGSDKPSEGSLRDPDVEMPVPQLADFTDTMFSSKDADDLRDGADTTGRIEHSQGQGVLPGASEGSSAHAEGNRTSSNSRAYDQDDQVQESTDPGGETEQFHDPQLDESSLQKQTSSSSYFDEHGEEKGKSAENASSDAEEGEEGENAGRSGLLASVGLALGSAMEAVGTKPGYYPSQEHTGSEARSNDEEEEDQGKSWTPRGSQSLKGNLPPITPQNSTVEDLDSDSSAPPSQSWIKKAVGKVFSPAKEKESTIEEEQEGGEEMDRKSEKKGTERDAFADASDSFVQ